MADDNVEQNETENEVEATAVEEQADPEAAAPEAEAEAEAAEPVEEAAEPEAVTADAETPAEAQHDTEEPEPTAAEAEAESAPSSASAKRKRKRLPRALRRQRTKPKREKPGERKPIARLPKPEHARGRRQERQGTVVSAAADKTIVVRVDVVKLHPTYKKVIRRSAKLHAHDEQNAAKVGDVVRIVETRPLSRMKRWRLQTIVEEAK